jgi:protocatechuate 3,4-dioxygenase beta subunit
MRWFLLALILCAALVSAQSDASQKTIRVEGTVLSLNGDPVRKATVRLQVTSAQAGQSPTSYSESTDSAGKFVFDDVAPGRYMLSADKPGFDTVRYGSRSNISVGTQFNLTAGMEMKDLAIKMTPQGVIAGKVMDQDGDPVISAQVQAMRSGYNRGRKQLQPTGGTTTNDLGEYRLINLAPGRYFISASDIRAVRVAQDADLRLGRGQEASITTFYPNAADASGGAAVDVAAGSEMRGTDIHLLQAKVYTVRGKAVDASGTPAILSLTRKNDNTNLPVFLNGGGSSQLRPDGTFEFHNILPGTYVLQLAQVISVNGNRPADLAGRVEVAVGNTNIDDLVLPLVPSPAITGTVKLEDGDIATLVKRAQNKPGVASAGNATSTIPGRLSLSLIQTENGPGGGSTTQVNEDGTFRFDNLSLGKYALNAVSLRGTYLKSARFGGQDVLHATIDTTSGAGGTLELVLSSKVATITGSVQSEKGEAVGGTMVTLWPKTPDVTEGVQFVTTDQNGAFKFQGLAPGDYYVAAWEELDFGLAQSAEFLNHFTSEASTITLAEGGQESRDLKPVEADKVAIEVAKLQ